MRARGAGAVPPGISGPTQYWEVKRRVEGAGGGVSFPSPGTKFSRT